MGVPWVRGDDVALLVCVDLHQGDQNAFWEAVLDHMLHETQRRRHRTTIMDHLKILFALETAKEFHDGVFSKGSRGLNLAPEEQRQIDDRVNALRGVATRGASNPNGDKNPKKRTAQEKSSNGTPNKRPKHVTHDPFLHSSDDEDSETSRNVANTHPPAHGMPSVRNREHQKSNRMERPPGRATNSIETGSAVGSKQTLPAAEKRIQSLEREVAALLRELGVYREQVARLDLDDNAFHNWDYGFAQQYLYEMRAEMVNCGDGFEHVRPLQTDQLAMPVELRELLCCMFNIPQDDMLRDGRVAIALRDPNTDFKVKIRAICAWLVCQWVFMSEFPKEDDNQKFVEIWAKMLASTQSIDGVLNLQRCMVQEYIQGDDFKQKVEKKGEMFTSKMLDMLTPFLEVQRQGSEGFGAYTPSDRETAEIKRDIGDVFKNALRLRAGWVVSPGRNWEVVPVPAGAEFDSKTMTVELETGFPAGKSPSEPGWTVRICTIPAVYQKKLRSYGSTAEKPPQSLDNIDNAFRTSRVVGSSSGGELWIKAHVVIYKPEKLEYSCGSIGAALRDSTPEESTP